MFRPVLSACAGLLLSTALVGCSSTSSELNGELAGESLLCRTGRLGQAINSTGKVPDGCVKIEGDEIGELPQTITLDGITVELTGWESKDGSGDYVGFTLTATGGSVVFAVKAGTETWAGSGTSWTHPKGKSGPAAKGISNITFCPGEPGSGSAPDGGSGTPDDGGNCTPGTPPEGGSPGEPCTTPSQCLSGQCSDGVCEPGAPGTPCQANGDCESQSCVAYLCEKPAPSGNSPGESCSEPADCLSGKCTASVCESGGAGTPCAASGDCSSNSCVNGLCEAGSGTPGGYMAPCSAALDCASRACVGGVCSDPNGPTTGESCSGDAACYSGSCQSSFCEGNGAGEPCRQASDCASGSTCNAGVCQGGTIG